MAYLLASLVLLALTPGVAWAVQHFQKTSKIFALFLILLISYTIFAHIIWENMEVYGYWAALVAVAGAMVFAIGDDFFFAEGRKPATWMFWALIQVFLFFHATIDGAALVSTELVSPQAIASGHRHDQELSFSILMHRMLFEVFVWKFFHDRFGRKAALFVLVNIASGTLLGFFGSRALFAAVPNSFGLFEAFIGGALLHLVYDYCKDQLKRRLV